jgi:hypothetical protein
MFSQSCQTAGLDNCPRCTESELVHHDASWVLRLSLVGALGFGDAYMYYGGVQCEVRLTALIALKPMK